MSTEKTPEILEFTLLDLFAAHAMQALIAAPLENWPEDYQSKSLADCAYEQAQTMLTARKKHIP